MRFGFQFDWDHWQGLLIFVPSLNCSRTLGGRNHSKNDALNLVGGTEGLRSMWIISSKQETTARTFSTDGLLCLITLKEHWLCIEHFEQLPPWFSTKSHPVRTLWQQEKVTQKVSEPQTLVSKITPAPNLLQMCRTYLRFSKAINPVFVEPSCWQSQHKANGSSGSQRRSENIDE